MTIAVFYCDHVGSSLNWTHPKTLVVCVMDMKPPQVVDSPTLRHQGDSQEGIYILKWQGIFDDYSIKF